MTCAISSVVKELEVLSSLPALKNKAVSAEIRKIVDVLEDFRKVKMSLQTGVFDETSTFFTKQNAEAAVKKVPGGSELLANGKLEVISREELAEVLSGSSVMSIIGEGSRLTRDKGLEEAKLGANNGWYQGPDNLWRYRLETSPVVKDYRLSEGTLPEGKYLLGELVSYDELFQSYPGLAMMEVKVGDFTNYYSAETHSIAVQEGRDLMSTLGHEVQHAIQRIDNMANGSTPNAVVSSSLYGQLREAASAFTLGIINARKAQNEVIKQYGEDHGVDPAEAYKATKEARSELVKELVQDIQDSIATSEKSTKEIQEMTSDLAKLVDAGAFDVVTLDYSLYLRVYGEAEARDAGNFWNGVISDEVGMKGLWFEDNQVLKAPPVVVQGLYNPGSKTSYLVYENLSKENLEAVVYHEVGVHAFLDTLKEAEKSGLTDTASKLYEDGLKSQDPLVSTLMHKVATRLDNSRIDKKDKSYKEEILAYMVEEAVKMGISLNDKTSIKEGMANLRKSLPQSVYDIVTRVISSWKNKMLRSEPQVLETKLTQLLGVISTGTQVVAASGRKKEVLQEGKQKTLEDIKALVSKELAQLMNTCKG